MKRMISILLISVLLLGMLPTAMAAAVLSTQKLTVDGKAVDCEKYNIDGANYFKLRDIAYLLSGTQAQFSVTWDAESRTVSIRTNESYTPDGSELALSGGDKSATAVLSRQTLKIDGETVTGLSVYNIGGNNYFKLRELGDALSFAVAYDAATRTAAVSSEKPAAAENIKVAMITDYGEVIDQSFNQTTYEACKNYCKANGLEFNFFRPATDSDAARTEMIKAAIGEGYNVLVMSGYTFGSAIKATVGAYPGVSFIALDVGADALGEDFTIPENLYCAVYREELCGYMAGYAAVKLGYRKLGFLGGMAVPAVVRYGCGYIQGIDAAAKALGINDVTVNYAYGNQFYGDPEITAEMNKWYDSGTEIVFACGGGIYTSAAEAAAKAHGKIIGVDVDQSFIIDGTYGEGITVTSAMKGLDVTVQTVLMKVVAGEFTGGAVDNLGIVSENAAENFVQLPDTTQFAAGFTRADYDALVADLYSGKLTVSSSITNKPSDFATVITVNDFGTIQ